MALLKSFDSFQEDFNKTWNKYVELHRELDKYRGIEISIKNIDAINKIISDLQDCFVELYGSLNFVINWNTNCMSALNEHKKFMDDIKASGGVPETEIHPMNDEAKA